MSNRLVIIMVRCRHVGKVTSPEDVVTYVLFLEQRWFVDS